MISEYVKNNHDEVYKYLLDRKNEYYNSTPTVSDEEFDAVEDLFREHFPTDSYFSSVGISAKGVSQVRHDIPMLSCAKAKTMEDVDKWLRKINFYDSLIVMPKVDGISCSIQYRDGKVYCLSTRGDGKVGTDITWLKDYIDIPTEISGNPNTFEIRGELFLPKNTEFNVNGKPLRSAASGLLNRKDSRSDCKYLKFVAYQYYENETLIDYFDCILDYIKDLSFDTVDYFIVFSIDDLTKCVENYKSKYRDEWEFETDGLVIQVRDMALYDDIDMHHVVDHHHHFNIALKPEPEKCNTIQKCVVWETSRNGNIIPVANFEPVYMGGKKIENATLNNYDNVEKLDLKVGDEICIVYANDVLPFFGSKVKDNNGKSCLIKVCPSCGGLLKRNGVHIQCTNPECPEQAIKSITYYCTKAEMDSVSESTIRTLFDNCFVRDYIDLYSLYEYKNELLAINGFGESKVSNLLNQIEKSKKCTMVQFLDRLGIELVGEKALIKLGIKTVDDFWKFKNRQYVIGQNLIDYRKKNKKGIRELLAQMNIKEDRVVESKGSVCMTGADPWKLGRKELEKKIQSMGYESVDSVSKTTSILVVDDLSSTSSKMAKAQKLGIRVMLYEEFFK